MSSNPTHLSKMSDVCAACVGVRSGRALGFTLVEIMTGMAIALIGVVIMMQVTLTFESQKRTTTGGDDAQNVGSIALHQLQRDLRLAGYGLSSMSMLGCSLVLRNTRTVTVAPVLVNPTGMPAIALGTDGRDAGTDSFIVMYASGNGSPEGTTISSQPSAKVYGVGVATDFSVDDLVIAARLTQPSPCSGASALVVDQVESIAGAELTMKTGVAGMSGQTLFDLGPRMSVVAYAVRNSTLRRCDMIANDCSGSADDTAIWVPIANGIAAIRAEYGRDTTVPMDGVVDVWDQTAPTTACAIAKAPVVRLGVLARSGQYEKTAVTGSGASFAAQLPTWSGATAFDLAANTKEPNWANYRYRVLEATVPLRNMTWLGNQAAC